MAEIKLSKNELRIQQGKLIQLNRYLPTLQLKKALLQAEVQETRAEIAAIAELYESERQAVEDFAALFLQPLPVNVSSCIRVTRIDKRYENIAGVEVPILENVLFEDVFYDLFETPIWLDGAITGIRKMTKIHIAKLVAEEKKAALENELRQVSIRVNLFEKVLIPRCETNIKKIKIFLGDQQLAAVSQAKVAKKKIEEQKQEALHAR